MSWRTALPRAPAPRAPRRPSRWIMASIALVGLNCLRSMTSPNASMFGASIAASRAASRAWPSSSPRSPASIQPIAHVTSSRELPVMCGTWNRSRTTVTPARGTGSSVPGPSSPSPKCSDLNLRPRSAGVTWSNSGVSASYISAWASAPGRADRPVLAGGDDVARGGGVVVGGGRRRGKGERRRGERGDPGHPRHATFRRDPRHAACLAGTARTARGLHARVCAGARSGDRGAWGAGARGRRRRHGARTRPRGPARSPSPCAPEAIWGAADRGFPAASVLKAMLLVAYARGHGDRAFTAAEQALLDPMIRRSDNPAANELFTRVGPTGLRAWPAPPAWAGSRR